MRTARFIQVALPAMLSTTLPLGCSLMAWDEFSSGASGSDGNVSDAASPTTDGAVSRTDGDAMPAPFCASLSPKPSVCLDFDGDPAFGSWTVDNAKGSKVEASSSAFVSPPRAGHFSRSAGAGAGGVMVLRYALAMSGAPEEIVLDADVRVDLTASNDELDIMAVTFPLGGGALELQLSVVDGTFRLQQWSFFSDGGSVGEDFSFQRPVVLGKWQHLRLTLKLGSTHKGLLEIDGVLAPEVSFPLPSGIGSPTIELGDGYLAGGASAFYMDNFTATTK